MSEDLNEITARLGSRYDTWKTYESEKNYYRDQFFKKATEELKKETAPQVVISVDCDSEEEARKYLTRRYSRFEVVSLDADGDSYKAVLQENPELRPFTYVNPQTGVVFQKSVSEGSPVLDDESLKEENPELWEAITEEVTERKIKPLDSLTPEQVAELERYVMLPKPTVRLVPPRKAKDEELDG